MIIHGRTIELSSNGSKPVGKAQVKIIGIWRTLSHVIKQSPAAPNLIFIYPPLYGHRASKTLCRGGGLSPVKGDDKVLSEPAKAGVDKIRLSNSQNLKYKDLLKIAVGDPYREEVLTVTKIDVGATADKPAWVTLSWPLMFSHREETIVYRLKQTWKASSNQLTEDGHRGHSSLLLDQLQGLTSNGYVRISSTSKSVPDEFHGLQIYETKSNDDGFYQLPPLQRVGQVQLQASVTGKKAEVKFQPDYSLYRNQLDLVLK